MAEQSTTTQIIQENPQIEAYRLGLLQSVQDFINSNLAGMPPPPIVPPAYQIAGLTPMQQQAAQMAQSGVGAYMPYLMAGTEASRRGQEYAESYGFGALQEANRLAAERRDRPYEFQGQAESYLSGSGEEFTPDRIQAFMNPYEQQVVEQALQDIRREGDIREQGLQAQAANVGAFGGSRQAVAEQELARNVAEQQARTAGQLRMAGYTEAGRQSQQAFEDARRREQQASQIASQIGLGYGQLSQADIAQMASLAQTGGQLGTQVGQLGLQQAGLGQLGQQMGLRDIQTMEALGGRDQALQQAILDAQRQTNMQMYQLPYQQYAFLSDIYKGTPSSQQVTQISQQPTPSTAQQIAGLGIAGLGAASSAKNLGLFG